MLGRCIRYTCWILSTAALLVLAVFAIIYLPGLKRSPTPAAVVTEFSRTDFVTIVLAAVSVILTAVGVVGAIAGVVGYATIRGAAEATARAVAAERAEKVAVETATTVASARAEEVATRVARSVVPQLSQGDRPDDDDAFARAEGGKE